MFHHVLFPYPHQNVENLQTYCLTAYSGGGVIIIHTNSKDLLASLKEQNISQINIKKYNFSTRYTAITYENSDINYLCKKTGKRKYTFLVNSHQIYDFVK
jgi:hypothetical protein